MNSVFLNSYSEFTDFFFNILIGKAVMMEVKDGS